MIYDQLMQLRKHYRIFKTLQSIPDQYWAKKVVESDISPTAIELKPESEEIFLKFLNLFLTKEKHDFLLEKNSLEQAKSLIKASDAKFSIDKNKELIIDIDGIKMLIETEQEISIIREIFLTGVYNYIYNQPMVVIDIGMNTGFASLYFAAQKNVECVFGYEPFKKTYEQALRNFALNPELSKKINPFDYGLGGQAEKITVEYDYSCKASIGVGGIDENYQTHQNQSLIKEEIIIKSIDEVFQSIIHQYPEINIIAKIDCEGSEYGIINSLCSTGQLSRVKAVMMEWHKKGPEPLIECLQQSGFAIFSRLPKSKNVGMLYAVKA